MRTDQLAHPLRINQLEDKSLPLSISRLRKKDSQGIIYIGKWEDLCEFRGHI